MKLQKRNEASGNFGYVAAISAKLLVICAFIAVLVATVNYVTKDKIALNQKQNTAAALTEIYKYDGMYFSVDKSGKYAISDKDGAPLGNCETEEVELLADIDAVYVIKNSDGSVYGYCVEASPTGFKDEVDLLVAVNSDMTAKDVRIISLSDTKGIGDKVKDRSFLDKFKGIEPGFSKDAVRMQDIIIAGSTRTSEPVTKAIDMSLEQIQILLGEGTDNAE